MPRTYAAKVTTTNVKPRTGGQALKKQAPRVQKRQQLAKKVRVEGKNFKLCCAAPFAISNDSTFIAGAKDPDVPSATQETYRQEVPGPSLIP